MISDYQHERLSWLLDDRVLDKSELQMLDDILKSQWFEHDQAVVTWIIDWLRKKPSRPLHGTMNRFLQGCRCNACLVAYDP